MEEVVILSAKRTPTGSFQGAFRSLSSPQLASHAIKGAIADAGISADQIDECLMGCVLSAGVGQAPARQAALLAGLPNSTRCTTINRVCGSGLRTAMWASQILKCGDAEVIVAGGMESMSQAPYLLDRAREGYRLGNGELTDAMIRDGLWDVYNDYHMGNAGELCAKKYDFTREEQDRYAKQSYKRALAAIESGAFKSEIVPIEISNRKGSQTIENDEDPFRAKLDKMGTLKPAFSREGTITAANASTLADGAAALVITTHTWAKKHGIKPIAKIVASENFAQAPEWFTTAPVGAIEKLLKKANLSANAIDLFEINEAFAVVALACIKELGLPEAKVNPRGGAIAIGHPLGASGARILTTLIHSLRKESKKTGIASLCIGGGEASAVLVEVVD